MKSSRKAISFAFISLLCGTSVVWLYRPFPPWSWGWWTTRLWFFEFLLFSLSMLISMICVLFAGVFLGRMARSNASQAESKLHGRLASIVTFLNVIILVLPVLNLISIFTPRTITGVVDLKIKGSGYICVREFETKSPWGQEVNFDDSTAIYVQSQKGNQHKEIVNIDAIQPGQVVEIRYIDNDTSFFWGIKALSVTILEGQHRPFQNENCGSALPE